MARELKEKPKAERARPGTAEEKVRHPRHRRRGHTRISRQNQVTLPVDAMRAAGLKPGDELKASSPKRGLVILQIEVDPLEALIGDMTGKYPPGWLDELRDEWER